MAATLKQGKELLADATLEDDALSIRFDALKRAGPNATDAKDLREKLRAAAVDPSVTYTTVIGQFHFDSNGDTSQKIISFYKYDPTVKDWVFKEQLDFGQGGGASASGQPAASQPAASPSSS